MTTKASAAASASASASAASKSKPKPKPCWQPAAMEPEYSAQVSELLRTDDGRRELSSLVRCRDEALRSRVKRHLLALGWTIQSRPNAAMLTRFRYVAPPGPGHEHDATKSYCSLPDVVVDSAAASSQFEFDQLQEEDEDGQIILVNRSNQPPVPPPQTKTNSISIRRDRDEQHDDDDEEEEEEDDDDDDDYGPEPAEDEEEDDDQQQHQEEEDKQDQAVIAEYIALMATNDRARGSSAGRLRDSAKSHLLACGWTFWMKLKSNGREELRYRAPTGRSYISLHTACQAFMNTTRHRQIVGGGSASASASNSNSKSSSKMDSRRVQNATTPATILRALRPGRVVGGDDGTSSRTKKRKLSELLGDDAVNVTMKKCCTTVKKNGTHQLTKKSITTTTTTLTSRKKKTASSKSQARVLLRPNNINNKASAASACQQQQRRSRTLLSVLIDRDIVVPRDKVTCRGATTANKHGYITGEGIRCTCGCNKTFTVAEFEAHATARARRGETNDSCRDAWSRVFLRDGRPLSRCLVDLMTRDTVAIATSISSSSTNGVRVKARCSDTDGDSVCSICNDGGDLLLCDNCPSAFHHECVGLQDTPDGDWFCPSCRCGVCGGTDFDHHHDTSTISSSGPAAAGFTDKTIIYCEQCEREYHVGCVRRRRGSDEEWCRRQDHEEEEEEWPPWLCGPECSKVFGHLQGLAAAATPIPTAAQGVSLRILRRRRRRRPNDDISSATTAAAALEHGALCGALDVLHECFVTLMEPRTQTDLAADLVFGRESELRRLNFRGYYVVGLEKAGELVTVGTLRVHGAHVAELPLVGTRFAHRRQGMCRLLLAELEKTLRHAGVQSLVLPAVPELLPMWTSSSLGFQPMAHADVAQIAKDHAILTFQGTTMCQKTLAAASS